MARSSLLASTRWGSPSDLADKVNVGRQRGQTSTREAAYAVGRRADSFVTEENRRSCVMFPTMQNDLTTADKSDILTRLMMLFAGDDQNYGLYDPTRARFNADKSKLEVGEGA